MVDERRRHDWDQTSLLVVYLHNTHIASRRDAIDIKDVHPMLRDRQDDAGTINAATGISNEEAFGLLKSLFVDKRGRA